MSRGRPVSENATARAWQGNSGGTTGARTESLGVAGGEKKEQGRSAADELTGERAEERVTGSQPLEQRRDSIPTR